MIKYGGTLLWNSFWSPYSRYLKCPIALAVLFCLRTAAAIMLLAEFSKHEATNLTSKWNINENGNLTRASFEEAIGPINQLSSLLIPNEGDRQLFHSINAAIKLILYNNQFSEQQRRNIWKNLWIPYVGNDSHVPYNLIPDLSICNDTETAIFVNEEDATGSFKEILTQKYVKYGSSFDLPPFNFYSSEKFVNYITDNIIRSDSINFEGRYNPIFPYVSGVDMSFINAIQFVFNYRYNSYIDFVPVNKNHGYCDFRTIADSLYNDDIQMYIGYVHKNQYRSKFFAFSCPLYIGGKFELLCFMSVHGDSLSYARWNQQNITIGILNYTPYPPVVNKYFNQAKILEYNNLYDMILAAESKLLTCMLIPPMVTFSVLSRRKLCKDPLTGKDICRIVGSFGENNYMFSIITRKYPVESPYINTYFDSSYSLTKQINCQSYV